MIRTVQCSSCSTSFPVDPRKVPEEGVYARCSACSAVFFVEGSPAPAMAPVAGGGFQAEPTGPDFGAGPPTEAEPAAEPEPSAPTGEWVFEREPEMDAAALQVERLDTVEEGLRHAQEAPSIQAAAEPPAPPAAAPEPTPASDAPRPSGFTFGRRDPHEKASRLARVLVSDIITYNPERHQRALEAGTLRQDFEDEIRKSWGEYVEQIGQELAESTDYFSKALNEILARGQQIF